VGFDAGGHLLMGHARQVAAEVEVLLRTSAGR
jgi:hypothetical protein